MPDDPDEGENEDDVQIEYEEEEVAVQLTERQARELGKYSRDQIAARFI